MSFTMFTVECPEHGQYEISPDSEKNCPRLCPIPKNGKSCGQNLKRIYNVPNVHFKGSGFTKTSA